MNLQEITNRTKNPARRWLSLGEDKELHLILSTGETIVTGKSVHLSLTTPHFDAFAKRLDKLGVAYFDWAGTPHAISDRADGVKQIYFQDPDNYWIEVNR